VVAVPVVAVVCAASDPSTAGNVAVLTKHELMRVLMPFRTRRTARR
jgi:hypothetical protein